MSRYIIDTDKHMSPFDGIVMTTLGGLEDADRAIESAYQRGLEDGKVQSERGCDGCRFEGIEIYLRPCSACRNAYPNQWTAKSPIDDGFVRGDVVVDERDGTRGIVVSSENKESNLLYVLFNEYRVPQSVVRKHYKKTGEHCDIDKFLDEIKGEDDK